MNFKENHIYLTLQRQMTSKDIAQWTL